MPLIASAEAPTPFGAIVAAVESTAAGALAAGIVAVEPDDLSLPPDVEVDGCRRFEVAIAAHAQAGVSASIGLRELPAGVRFGPASGQHMISAEIEHSGRVLVVATHDGEWLSSRAARHGLLPRRFAVPNADTRDAAVLYRDQGLLLVLPQLRAGETVRLFFGCAWASAQRSSDASADAWFAAEAALPWTFPDDDD